MSPAVTRGNRQQAPPRFFVRYGKCCRRYPRELENEAAALLPAHFSSENAETRRRGSGLSGEDLYLFPDRSYYYVHWADIEPPTIYDKGFWSFSQGVLELHGDHSYRQSDESLAIGVLSHYITVFLVNPRCCCSA